MNIISEIKWERITDNYKDKYIALIDLFFDYVARGQLKPRIMFTQNIHIAENLTQYHHDAKYFLLYYEFIKYAFGLQHANPTANPLRIRLNLDRLPDTGEHVRAFRQRIVSLNYDPQFKRRGIQFSEQQIAEVNSENHVILQCLDIVLGSMQFKLNDKHKIKPPGKHRRGKRTIAKEKVYKHIYSRIRALHKNFNPGITTGHQGDQSNRWNHPYRHWLFTPKNRSVNTDYKAKNKK